MATRDTFERYGSVSRVFHWGMAVLVLWQFLTAGARVLAEDTAFESFMWSTHKPLGLLLIVLIVIRAVWALTNLANRPSSVNRLATMGHLALYGLLFTIPALALLRQYGSGRSFEPFGIPLFSGFEGDKIEWMMAPANLLHSWLGWLMLVMIIGHIVMVRVHRKSANHEDVLPRMLGGGGS